MDNTIVPVILSGGAGTRLWPVSREAHPKPFIKLPDGESLLQKTFTRACALPNVSNIITITNQSYYLKHKAEYDLSKATFIPAVDFLLEPYARNTAGAIAIAALKTAEQYGKDAIMLVLPADHLIMPIDNFVTACQTAATVAAENKLVTFGIQPTHPETGYGYIECGNTASTEAVAQAKRFIEKPCIEKAERYVTSGKYLWNSGMFCFTASCILAQLVQHAPALLAAAERCWEASKTDNCNVTSLDEPTFSQLEDISIDYAVMEQAENINVVSCDFDWQDIGSWEAYRKQFAADDWGNTVLGDTVMIDSTNNFIHSDSRMIATIGIENMAIIDTADALLITPRNRAQDVKKVVKELKAQQHESTTTHRTVIRPWGTYTVLEEGPAFKIKRIVVKPGASLSLQRHQHRSEHWVVVEGTAKVVNADKESLLQTNESTFVPMQTPHRLSNPGAKDLVIIEVQTGSYLGEDDIERLEDTYGRV